MQEFEWYINGFIDTLKGILKEAAKEGERNTFRPAYQGKNYWQACCPSTTMSTRAWRFTWDHLYCFRCGAHGDVIDFIRRVEHSLD